MERYVRNAFAKSVMDLDLIILRIDHVTESFQDEAGFDFDNKLNNR